MLFSIIDGLSCTMDVLFSVRDGLFCIIWYDRSRAGYFSTQHVFVRDLKHNLKETALGPYAVTQLMETLGLVLYKVQDQLTYLVFIGYGVMHWQKNSQWLFYLAISGMWLAAHFQLFMYMESFPSWEFTNHGMLTSSLCSDQLLLDLMAFREQALRLLLDLSSTVITLLVSTLSM